MFHDFQSKGLLRGLSLTIGCHLVWESLTVFWEDELLSATRAQSTPVPVRPDRPEEKSRAPKSLEAFHQLS